MDLIRLLADPAPVARLQRFCGVEYDSPITCDQHTQTRKVSIGSSDPVKEAQASITPPENGCKDSAEVHNGDTNCMNIYQEYDYTNAQEPNNNFYKKNRRNYLNSEDEQTKCKSRTYAQTNGYHVICQDSKHYNGVSKTDCSNGSLGEFPKAVDESIPEETNNRIDRVNTPTVRIKYKSLFYLARFGAFLGHELFYLTFFPFLIWNLDSLVVRQVSMLWCVVMYLGQATKDYLRWPRPVCPPVVRLEIHYSREYAMPSTHAMSGTAIPLYLAYLAIERYQVPMSVAAALALCWFCVTCWSRLYLGVHSILDLLVGFVYALAIFFTFLGYVEGYDLYQQTHPFSGPVLLFTGLTMCTVLYPTHHKNSSKADAVQIVAAYTGFAIGNWLGYQLGYMQESDISKPYSIAVPTLSWCFVSLLRFITGVAVIGFLHTVTRWWSIRFFSYIYGLGEPDKTHPGVMMAYKFTTYATVGSGAALFAPLLHLRLGIHRPALFYEVL
ncbi:unnamed protein product [Candidula unifasciata]|uniref:Phosphatidic acid phosphatase type 2/haloperoxidase domain-containing protein n=1 Tax=Candidula unifasciata TaxID=100452 RepID=A0A8S3YI21_9EUPU|nr:unnamed protein product [Candidula unifasciata]